MNLYISAAEYDYHTLRKVAEMAGLTGIIGFHEAGDGYLVTFPDGENTEALSTIIKVGCAIWKTTFGCTNVGIQIGSYDSVHMYGGSESFHKALKSKARGLMKPSMKKIVL